VAWLRGRKIKNVLKDFPKILRRRLLEISMDIQYTKDDQE